MRHFRWTRLPPLEEKVAEWSKDHPVIWNLGAGPTASFVRTLTRLLFERTKDIYGPYDHIIHVRLTSAAAVESSIAQRWLALQALMEMPLPDDSKIHEIKQLAAEETYFGYGTISDNLMLQAFGRYYVDWFGSDPSVRWEPNYHRQQTYSPLLTRIRQALQGKRLLLLVENLHVPVSLDVLIFAMDKWPSPLHNRWLISTTSRDVCDQSRQARGIRAKDLHLSPEYYHALTFNDLHERDWTMLIKEALRDAVGYIHSALQHQRRDKKYWLRVAHDCLYYGVLYQPLQGAASHTSSVTSDELIRCWVAEGLILSTTSPTGSKNLSNLYRSAYEAGKVVIQALQEYSLLPIYSASTSTSGTSSSSQDVTTGISKLAEGVPRLKQDEHLDHEHSKRLRWVSFLNEDGRHVSWDWSENTEVISREINTSTLIVRGCSNISGFPFDKVFNSHLRVLDLSYTQIDYLPPGFSQLQNLHLLSLRGCSRLKTLSSPPSSKQTPPPLTHLENLQVLDMMGVPLLKVTQQDISKKSNLRYLDVSGSRFTTLPSEFFCQMSGLEELIFGNCSCFKELPPSLAKLSNLLFLHVEGTKITCFPEDTFEAMQRLCTLKLINNKLLMSLPLSLSEAKGLKELHISNCTTLRLHSLWALLPFLEDLHIQTWKALGDIKIHGHPNLRTFSLSGPWIRSLSLRGCSKLKIVNFSDDLAALEDVDLSATALEEVPHNLPNLPQLRILLLLNVPAFRRFPWHQLVRFPKVFCLDHGANDDNRFSKIFYQKKNYTIEYQQEDKTTNTAHININDPKMFHSFNADAANKLVKVERYLESFKIQVKPCSVRGLEAKNKECEICTKIQRQVPYTDVHSSEAASIDPMMKLQPKKRHVEISANNQYPQGLRHLLSVTESLFIMDDYFVKCLTDLNYIMTCLEECQLIRCHQMEVVFKMHSEGSGALAYFNAEYIRIPDVFSSLLILQVSNINILLSLVEPSDLAYSKTVTMKLLKHIHVEHCPRLEKLFPCSLSLPALETLVIIFCSNLKTIFYEQPRYEVVPSPLPNIKRVYLQELPQLLHIHSNTMFRFETPKWENLFVRGCRSFQHLPLLKKECLKSKVVVSGERDWWDNLQLRLPEQNEYYFQVPPPAFASRKKHVIKSYLR